jgi:hypothetical protein
MDKNCINKVCAELNYESNKLTTSLYFLKSKEFSLEKSRFLAFLKYDYNSYVSNDKSTNNLNIYY